MYMRNISGLLKVYIWSIIRNKKSSVLYLGLKREEGGEEGKQIFIIRVRITVWRRSSVALPAGPGHPELFPAIKG
jgi:hypothetical protein